MNEMEKRNLEIKNRRCFDNKPSFVTVQEYDSVSKGLDLLMNACNYVKEKPLKNLWHESILLESENVSVIVIKKDCNRRDEADKKEVLELIARSL